MFRAVQRATSRSSRFFHPGTPLSRPTGGFDVKPDFDMRQAAAAKRDTTAALLLGGTFAMGLYYGPSLLELKMKHLQAGINSLTEDAHLKHEQAEEIASRNQKTP